MAFLRSQLQAWAVLSTPSPDWVTPDFQFLYSLKPWPLKSLLSSLDSQFCTLLDFLKSRLAHKWLRNQKMSWKEIISSFAPPSLWSSFLQNLFPKPQVLWWLAINTKSLISSVQWNYCFLLSLYSLSFPLLFPTCPHVHIPLLKPVDCHILRPQHPRWVWNSSPCSFILQLEPLKSGLHWWFSSAFKWLFYEFYRYYSIFVRRVSLMKAALSLL